MRHGREQDAEERVGALLDRELDDVAIVLHDLHVPGSEVRVDHVVVAVNGRAKDVPIRAALCFNAEHWGGAPQPFWIDGVLVTHPADLVERVRAAGPLDEDIVGWIAARLSLDKSAPAA